MPAADAATPADYRLAVMDGDGIGPEITPATVRAVDAALQRVDGPTVDWLPLPLGRTAIDTHGSAIPEETIQALTGMDAWILGPHDSASYPEPHRALLNPSGTIRKRFDLFANIRPARTFVAGGTISAGATRASGIDLVIARENTEGFYADRNTHQGTGEMMPTSDVAIMHGIITRKGTERIAHEAFRLAASRRKKVTIVHKANVLSMTTGLFRDVCYEVAQQYPEVAVDDLHIDASTVHLLRRGADFDVIVTENMFGDILSDLTGELAGSLGIAPSINSSHTQAMAQASHGSAPDIAGRDLANPTALMLSAALLMRWLSRRHDDERLGRAADELEQAVTATIGAGIATRDLGGDAGTTVFTDAVVAALES